MDWQDGLGNSPLHWTAWNGSVKKMMILIKHEANLNIKDMLGNTPLMWAARKNKMACVRELVWSLCDTKIRNDENKTAAEVAEECGNHALAEYLANQSLRHQAEIRADSSRRKALRQHYAKRDSDGKALSAACGRGQTGKAEALIAGGAPVNWQTENGISPLHEASYDGRTAAIKLLIESKANINIVDKAGDTPLIHAAYKGWMRAVCVLVESGADIAIRGKEHKTAKQWAHHGRGTGLVAEYLDDAMRTLLFHPSARDESGQLHPARGRGKRAFIRDCVEIAGFDDHMAHKFMQFCTR